MPETSLGLWIGFNLFVLVLLALDLGVFHRKAHAVSLRRRAIWSAVWVALALLFDAGLYACSGREPALEFLTGYLIEKSLSVDNIFVFVVIFGYFAVPAAYQHRVLFWGILGALVMRAAFILAGAALLAQLPLGDLRLRRLPGLHRRQAWLLQPRRGDPPREQPGGPRWRGAAPGDRRVPTASASSCARAGGGWPRRCSWCCWWSRPPTSSSRVDSIPAIFAVTRDPFIVFTSNVFAILGLRSLYFLLAGVIGKFHYLKLGLSSVLVFVGAKMLLADLYKIPSLVSLAVIAALLAVAVAASLWKSRRDGPA